MTSALTVSVVIVSRERPAALRRCLIGLSQLFYHPFEIVVVADPDSCAQLRGLPQAALAKVIPFDQANISVARNLGIAAAAGQIIAFIDDDAVPEPTWLTYLSAPFSDPSVMASGGWVRGRNGISWQSQSQTVDHQGRTHPLQVRPDRATILTPTADRAIKTEGTNMAVRRSCLVALGGFDPRYRFFLDETDLNLRLAMRGLKTALVPLAEVHHGYAASVRRRADRVPTDLSEIGASWAVFLATHCPPDQQAAAWDRIRAEERARALRHMVSGALEPRDVRRLLRGLEAGFSLGQGRVAEPLSPLPDPEQPFAPVSGHRTPDPVVISGRRLSLERVRRKARAAVAAGHSVSLFCLSFSALYHRVRFSDDGVWEQTGGQFGRSERTHKLISRWGFSQRIQSEVNRVQPVRGAPDLNVLETAHR